MGNELFIIHLLFIFIIRQVVVSGQHNIAFFLEIEVLESKHLHIEQGSVIMELVFIRLEIRKQS